MGVTYYLKSLDEVSTSLNYDFDYGNVNIDALKYKYAFRVYPLKEQSCIGVNFVINIHSEDVSTLLAHEEVRCLFIVEPFDDFVTGYGEDSIEVTNPKLIDTFINISIGAARGVMAKSLKGTPLAKCVFPLVPMSAIKEEKPKKKK